MTFRIPYPSTKEGRRIWAQEYGLNAYWAGKHWSKRKRDAEFWHHLTRLELGRQIPDAKMFDGPVSLRFRWDDHLDLSNHAAIAKMIEDALKGRVIKDDSRAWVKGIIHEWWDGEAVEITVEPWEEVD